MQAADQVVVALQELFQVVYELKKKEVEGDTNATSESKTEETTTNNGNNDHDTVSLT